MIVNFINIYLNSEKLCISLNDNEKKNIKMIL